MSIVNPTFLDCVHTSTSRIQPESRSVLVFNLFFILSGHLDNQTPDVNIPVHYVKRV